MESRRNSRGTSSQDLIRCSSAEVKNLLYWLGETPGKFTGRLLFMSMFNDISCGTLDNKNEYLANARLVSLYARKFGKGQWSFIGLGSEKKWYSLTEDSPQGIWDNLAEKMLLEFAKSGCPIFRATTPVSRGQLKSKRHGKLSVQFAAVRETIETIFRITVSANQLSLHGAVAEMCEEYESLHERTVRLVVMGQSIVLSAIKTEVSLESDDPAYQNFLFQQHEDRIEKLSQQDKLSKLCMDAGFLSVVENSQYFMTKDTADLSQFHAVACREYTLPREEASQPKGWIQRNSKIGPVSEIATSYLHGKYGIEIRIISMNRDNTHSWVRISHGSTKFVMNLNNNETEIPEDQLEEYALKLSAKYFACRSKATAKPQRREPAGSSPRIVPMERRNWIDIGPEKRSLSEYEVSKKVIHLPRHSQQVHREEGGAVHFWRIKENLQNQFPHWSLNNVLEKIQRWHLRDHEQFSSFQTRFQVAPPSSSTRGLQALDWGCQPE